MPKYTFVVVGGISLHVDVEADSLDEAITEAQQASTKSLCYQCAHASQGEWSTSGELDCDPSSGELVDLFIDEEQGDLSAAQEKWNK